MFTGGTDPRAMITSFVRCTYGYVLAATFDQFGQGETMGVAEE